MIVEYIHYQLSDHEPEAFEAAYARAAPFLDQSPQCLSYELSRCHEEPLRYVLRIEWESLEAHEQGFRKGPQFPGFLAEIRAFIPEIQHMKHYQRTAVGSDGATTSDEASV